ILKGLGYKTCVFIEDVEPPDWKEVDSYQIVGISTITSTAPRAYKIADKLRANGKTVIMGGPHVTFLPEEALGHCDFVVRGEGEHTIVELLRAIEDKSSFGNIDGLSWNSPEGPVHNEKRGLIADLDPYPAPDFSLVRGWSPKVILPIATSRGCPFDCSFCSVIHMFGRKYRFKGIDKVMEEIRSGVGRETGKTASFVFFIDDNFTANKNRTKELLRRIINDGLKFNWSAQVRSDAASDPELLDLMKRSGCENVFIGFESVNEKTLQLFNKKQGVEDIVRAVQAFHARGIRIHGMFVLGSDTDDITTIRDTQIFARKMDIESVQFMILTPLPGTPVYEELKTQGRILHNDWSRYDAHYAVFRPELMSPSELQRETFKAMAKFYSWSKILRHVSRLNFYCGMLGLYGKHAVKKARAESERYLRDMKELANLPPLKTQIK
ncbi:MAG: B12-binding domain-containing radical SAM protein, partial [Nitrospirota bacterium]